MDYTRRDLALAYLKAHRMPEFGPTPPESLAARLKTHHEELLRGLRHLFGFSLEGEPALRFFFNSVAHSYRSNTHPLSGMLEGGLLYKRVEGTGTLEVCEELAGLHRQSQERHVDLAEMILALAKPDNGEIVTSEQLKAIGVDDEEPTDPDFEWY
ncbi:hypothetical protein OG205_37175 [Lentzea sp. NBC_00516]|uniref:hypothetical protein n=1 Tax=Lentzea sp. NBC_00516 TaxID=2903582 RepID=UPI002E819212|nr:hypothetical protein [Lentzea sp. NBC_00516]WUD23634.1 hypothetical protein OG205_37175 [Lentzea sp. NBC_00516]